MLDIIIPVYNLPDLTIKCIESIIEYTKNYRIILIDNNSEPENFEKVAKALQKTNHFIIRNQENLGFVKAINQGLATSTAPYVCLLNNDTEVEEGWADKMISTFDDYPLCGIVGPLTSAPNCWQNKQEVLAKLEEPIPKVKRINNMLAFFCAIIKRDVIKEIGYLDEKFGIGFGDDDYYCFKARRAGFELYLRTDVLIKHHHRSTFKKYIPNWEDIQTDNLKLFQILTQPKINFLPGLVSIIIPHKQNRNIEPTLESIRKQTYTNYEIIISRDTTKNANIARNAGALKAKGEFLFFCDDDIILEPNCLEEMVQALKMFPDASLAYCNYTREGNLTGNIYAQKWNLERLKIDNYISTMSLIRRSDFPPSGFDPKVKRLQDWDLWLNMGLSGKHGVWINDILFKAFYRGDGITEVEDYAEAKKYIKNKYNI